ncbi:hypothetical protein [Streptomyces sp. H34-S4]|uniref:hypothetical protein n=1 Tax=Streptomyces sp. H34-S4 TaxID=2996463 RepID=UPI00226DB00F|nr:hypothetical protein [Streptomyces sp. H34-S4]MCY0933658.1 hypothetical protein [Streptomyces sp. H34-S4]
MSNEPEFEIKHADTTFYLRILHAERKTYGGGYRGEKATEEICGRVQISTDPQWKADTDLGFVKVRGRKYAIEHIQKRTVEGESRLTRSGIFSNWDYEPGYLGGYRNDRGGQVDYSAKAWDSLKEIERDVLDQFEKENPDWQTTSIRQLFEYERDHLLSKAERKRKDAHEAERLAATWQARLDELAA